LEKNFSQLAIKEVLPSELLGNGKQTTKKFTLLQLCPQRPFYEGSECKVNICQNYFKMVSGFLEVFLVNEHFQRQITRELSSDEF